MCTLMKKNTILINFCCSKTEKKVPRYPKVLTTLGICVLCIFEFLFWLYVSSNLVVSKGNLIFFFGSLHVMNVKYANFDKYLSVAVIAEKYLKFLDLLSFKSAKCCNFLVCLFVCSFGFLPQALIQNRIKLSSMTGVYALLAVGAVFAFVVLIAEIQWKRKHKMLRNIPRCVKNFK